jgi:hypothetical protein
MLAVNPLEHLLRVGQMMGKMFKVSQMNKLTLKKVQMKSSKKKNQDTQNLFQSREKNKTQKEITNHNLNSLKLPSSKTKQKTFLRTMEKPL